MTSMLLLSLQKSLRFFLHKWSSNPSARCHQIISLTILLLSKQLCFIKSTNKNNWLVIVELKMMRSQAWKKKRRNLQCLSATLKIHLSVSLVVDVKDLKVVRGSGDKPVEEKKLFFSVIICRWVQAEPPLVLIKDPESAQSKTETRPSKTAPELGLRPFKRPQALLDSWEWSRCSSAEQPVWMWLSECVLACLHLKKTKNKNKIRKKDDTTISGGFLRNGGRRRG